jgi:cell volume regulation protein A
MNISVEHILFVASLLILVSVFASKASDRLGLPALLLFLVVGMLAGSEGPGRILFVNLGTAKFVGIAALVFILFYGGLDTKWSNIKPVLGHGISLATLGVIITAAIMGFLLSWFLKMPLMQSLLLGAIVSSTDAAAVFSILRAKGISLKDNIGPLLELESGSNDPMAVFLTLGLIEVMTHQNISAAGLIPEFFLEMSIGVLAGYFGGKLTVFVINKINLDNEGLYPVLMMALTLFIYAASAYVKGNGFLSVYVAGLVVGNQKYIYKRDITRFNEGIAWLMQIAMFLTLGLLVYPSRLIPVAGPGIMAALFLMLVARPISVFISLAFSGYGIREKLMISWVGLRGAVPVILAIFPLIAGVQGADVIFNIVFFIVLLSALLQGGSIAFVSRLLKVEAPAQGKRRYPIEFEHLAGVNADLNEVMVPFGSGVVGKRIFEIGVPEGCLITLISRGEHFIVPNGTTVLEEGDVMLAMAEKAALKQLEKVVAVQKQQPAVREDFE